MTGIGMFAAASGRRVGNGLAMVARWVTLAGIGLVLAGCLGLAHYYDASDAPDHIKAGKGDLRLTTTRVLGGPLSPIVRNIAVPRGKLANAPGLRQYLRDNLRPLDVFIVRSRPALTRLAFPTHFTHVAIWLGENGELQRSGIASLPNVRPHAENLANGKTVYESANDDVHLSDMFEVVNTTEIAVVRLDAARHGQRERYRQIFGYLGEPFDYNFDLKDERRLTCIEVLAKVYPELDLPVRYTTGRYTYIPDDLARMAAEPGNGVSLVAYITGDGKGGFTVHDGATMLGALSSPSMRKSTGPV